MTEKKIFLVIMVATIVILSGGTYLISRTSTPAAQVSASANVKAEAAETRFSWGEIKMSKGNVSKTFTINNTGTENLKLTGVKTSCHCTKAQIVIDGQSSPLFGMNTVSSWVGEVAPGKQAQLTAVFDPNFHGPGGVGSIERLVRVQTNDVAQPMLEFIMTGNVVNDLTSEKK